MKGSLYIRDIVEFNSRDLSKLEKQALKFGNDGKRAIRNAHKAAIDMINEKARKRYANMTTATIKGRRGKGGATTFDRKGKQKKIIGFRAGIAKKGSWTTKTEFKKDGVTTRSWINGSQYYNFLAPAIEWGWTPGKGSKSEARRVEGQEIRYGIATRMRDKVVDAMVQAIVTQMATGKTMTPKELANAL